MEATDHFERVALRGDTYRHRGLLALWGCRYDRRRRVWLARKEDAEWIQRYIDRGGAAAEIKVRAERRAGEMLREMEKNKGTRLGGNTVLPPENTTKLNDIGISKMQSSRFQQAASVPEEQFERHIDEKKAASKPITSSGVAKLAAARADLDE